MIIREVIMAIDNIVLQAVALTKTFSEGSVPVPVLHGIDLSLERGEVVSLEGPSGSGKTTLLSIFGCILTPTSGEVIVDGRAVNTPRSRGLADVRRHSIG